MCQSRLPRDILLVKRCAYYIGRQRRKRTRVISIVCAHKHLVLENDCPNYTKREFEVAVDDI